MEVHFALAHFPIALLVAGGAWLLAVLVTGHKGAGRTTALGILAVGAVLSIPTVAAGLWIAAEHESHHTGPLETHRLVGIATMVAALLGLCSHWLRQRIPNADIVRNLFFLTAAVLAGVAGMLGGEMSHGSRSEATTEHAHGSDAHNEHAAHAPEAERHRGITPDTHQVGSAKPTSKSASPRTTEHEAAPIDPEDQNTHKQGHGHDRDHTH